MGKRHWPLAGPGEPLDEPGLHRRRNLCLQHVLEARIGLLEGRMASGYNCCASVRLLLIEDCCDGLAEAAKEAGEWCNRRLATSVERHPAKCVETFVLRRGQFSRPTSH